MISYRQCASCVISPGAGWEHIFCHTPPIFFYTLYPISEITWLACGWPFSCTRFVLPNKLSWRPRPSAFLVCQAFRELLLFRTDARSNNNRIKHTTPYKTLKLNLHFSDNSRNDPICTRWPKSRYFLDVLFKNMIKQRFV